MKSVIFIAPPSAGKGTQSMILEKLGYVHISTGDMLREEINKKSSLGNEISAIMSKGNLVSDEIVFTLIKNKLRTIHKPFILDGYPRTIKQLYLLEELFQELHIQDYEVIYFDITMEEALKRALGRLTCSCGASYNKYYDNLKPQREGICDKCGSILIQRNDDNEETFKNRFATFIQNNDEIKKYYEKKKKLHIVDAMASSEQIADRIKEILK